ncbi:MAG: carbohydrate-binding family 9-like protein [Planctomycetota bacterium]
MRRSLAALALLVAACAPAEEQEGFTIPSIPFAPRAYVCARAPSPPAIDGRLDDPAWRAAAWTDDFVDIFGPSRPAPRHRTRARMLWDGERFYVGAEITEPHVWGTLTERDAVIFNDNDFEVFLDPDGDTHGYFELEVNALGTVWDLYLTRPYRDGGPAVEGWDIHGLGCAVHVDGTVNDPSDTDRGWTVEVAIPWAALGDPRDPSVPAPGDRWRVNFSRVQWRARVVDGRYEKLPGPEDNWVWSPQGLVNMHYPEMWGYVQFSERASDPFVPEVDADERWFLRRVYYRQRAWRTGHDAFAADLGALGLAPPPGSRFEMRATPRLFEASLEAPGGRRVVITQDGRVRAEEERR